MTSRFPATFAFPLSLACLFCLVSFPAPGEEAAAGPPLTFADAESLAIGAALELKEAFAQGALKAGTWRLALRSYLPRLSLAAGQDDRLSLASRDSFQKTYSLTLRQQLWDGGRLAQARSQEKEDLLREEAALGRLSQEIAESAVSAYRRVLAARALLAIRERFYADVREQAKYLEVEAGRGLATKRDVEEARLSLAEQAWELDSLRLNLRDGEEGLASLLGLPALPRLAETIDVHSPAVYPAEDEIFSLAQGANPELMAARVALGRLQEKKASVETAWFPAISVQADGSLLGDSYPLTRAAWSVGVNLDLSSPWFRGTLSAGMGWEFPEARTARFQVQLEPMPDPASSMATRSARTNLALERERYAALADRVGRAALLALEKCRLYRTKRNLAGERLRQGRETTLLALFSVGLGQSSRLESMRALTEEARLEVALLDAAVELLESERDLERLLGIAPGTLGDLVRPEDTGRGI
jgi:outer membrane protein TolC